MTERETLPVIPLRSAVVFPGVTAPIAVGRKSSLRAIEAASEGDGRVFVVAQRKNVDEPDEAQLYTLGTIAKVGQVQTAQGGVHVLLEGQTRATALDYRTGGDHRRAVVLPVADVPPPDAEDAAFKALYEELRARATELGKARGVPEPILSRLLRSVSQPEGSAMNDPASA